MSQSVDFSAFVFSPDDIGIMRSNETYVVRDNVIFELGLFIGAIGKERCFIVKPRGVELHLPSDLVGVTSTDYDPNRSDDNFTSSLTYASTQIKREIDKKGSFKEIITSKIHKVDFNKVLKDVSDTDLTVLSVLLGSYNCDVEGCSSWSLKNELSHLPEPQINISIVKLQKIGLISKENSFDEQNYHNYFSYKLTDYGLEVCLKNEDKIIDLSNTQTYSPYAPQQSY
jgi:hypothetical protein